MIVLRSAYSASSGRRGRSTIASRTAQGSVIQAGNSAGVPSDCSMRIWLLPPYCKRRTTFHPHVGDVGIGSARQAAVLGQYVVVSKGTMSELELSLFRQRSQEALKQKASRGALILGAAGGYVKVGRDRIEKNPDQRVREALQLVFSKFTEFQSVRQVHISSRDEAIELPVKSRNGETRGIIWRLPMPNGTPVGPAGIRASLDCTRHSSAFGIDGKAQWREPGSLSQGSTGQDR
jgi:hypothetical protein